MKNYLHKIHALLICLTIIGISLDTRHLQGQESRNYVYKNYLYPHLLDLPDIFPEGMESDPELIGKELCKAVQENPYYQDDQILWGVSSSCSQHESESGESTVSQAYIQRPDIVEQRRANIISQKKKQFERKAWSEVKALGIKSKSERKNRVKIIVEEKIQEELEQSWPAIGSACRSESCWPDDHKKIQELGCNLYRFSVDWSRVEPKPGVYNRKEIKRYVKQCRDLVAKGIKPIICFHHYMDPIWFMDQGGFANPENIIAFVEFCEIIAHELSKAGVTDWLIMNQPAAYAIKSYRQGLQPPFVMGGPYKLVLQNILKAHLHLFKSIKAIGPEHCVGVSHQIATMKANRRWSLIDPFIAHIADKIYNGTMLRFMGDYKDEFDFMALSYYSPCRFKLTDSTAFWDSERIGNETDDPNRIIDGPGFYDAIVRVADHIGKEKPIIVIESGLTANENREGGTRKRINYFNKTMPALIRAIQYGYYIKGFCVWTLMDSYEWCTGYNSNFGLYTRRTGKDHGTLKIGGAYYQAIITEYREYNYE